MTSSGDKDNPRRISAAMAVLFVSVGVLRIISTYSVTAQAFDEPCHVAAAIEFLDRHTYNLDPVHPPLARIGIGLPLYLAGVRFPNLPPLDHTATYNDVGNAILYHAGNYGRNLKLARSGVLPFFLLGAAIVFLWARREYGDFAALMAVAIFTTLPNVLALSSIAYTDMAAGATQAAAFLAFAIWLDKRTTRSATVLGFALALALSAKATTCIFFPAAAVTILAVKWATTRRQEAAQSPPHWSLVRHMALVFAIVVVTVWAAYGFSFGHLRVGMQLSPESMPSFQHFPKPVAAVARKLILSDPNIPAPALLKGAAVAWVLNQTHPPAYLFGRVKDGGWWYFFLVGVAVKSPLPFLILAVVGTLAVVRTLGSATMDPRRRWLAMAPASCALAVFLVTMPVKYNAGVRHVMVVFPLLAIMAGRGCSLLWYKKGKLRWTARFALVVLLCWQCISTVRASGDFIAYFNELAGSDPSKVMVAGCDLDCGQDLFRLSREFQDRHISHATIAVWTSADPSQMHLPDFDVPVAFRPVTGWFAISLRALRFGDSFHTTYAPGAFDWLKAYQPVGRVGKTILLYDLPEGPGQSAAGAKAQP